MTSSFNTVVGTQRDAPPDISKWNYASTEADLTKSINSEIDETTKAMNDHFSLVIQQENQYHKNRQEKHKQLLELIPKAIETYVDIRDRREAAAVYNDFIPLDGNQVKDEINSKKKEAAEKKIDAQFKETDELIKQGNEVSGQIQVYQDEFLKDNQTDAGKIAQDAVVRTANTRNTIAELSDAFEMGWPRFKAIASEEYLHEMPDGRWLTLNQAKGESDEYWRIAYKGTVELFLAQTIAGKKYSRRLLTKYLAYPIFQDFQKDKKGYVKAQVDAQKALMEKDRAAALGASLKQFASTPTETVEEENLTDTEIEEKNAKALGTKITDYLGHYHGFHAYSWSAGRAEMFKFIEQAWESKELSDQDIIRIGDSIIKGHDGKYRRLKNYWGKEYGGLRKKVRIEQGEAIAQFDQDIDTKQHNWWQEKKGSEEWQEIMEGESTNEQKEEYLKRLEQEGWDKGWDKPVQELKYNISRFEDLSPDIEEDRFKFYWARHEAGYRTDPSVLSEFDPTGPYYNKIKAIVDGPNMDTAQVNSAKSFIKGQTIEYTKETDGKTEKTAKFRAIEDQATIAFAEHFRAQKSLGKTDEQAMSFARTEIKKEIESGLYNQYPAYNPDHTAAQDMLAIKEKIKADPTHFSSKEPWVGEEVHLQAALQYYQLGEGFIRTGPDPTEYYKNFSKLGNKTWSVSDVMKHRLISTGLMNDDNVVDPVKALALKEQILLNHKTSPGRTYRVLEDQEGKEGLLKYTDFNHLSQLYTSVRADAQVRNSYITPSLDWIQLVNIDPELLDEYTGIVGETPFFMHLDNLLPGVAEEQVKRTLIEPKEPFDMATLGQPVPAGESWQKTGIAQTIVGTRELVMNALTDEAGNLNATGRVIARMITGEGARDIETWIQTAPIGKIISFLDGILDGPTMEEISKSTE